MFPGLNVTRSPKHQILVVFAAPMGSEHDIFSLSKDCILCYSILVLKSFITPNKIVMDSEVVQNKVRSADEERVIKPLNRSFVLPNNGRTLKIGTRCYHAIMAGHKSLEVRVGYDCIKLYQEGDRIELLTPRSSGLVLVKSVRIYLNLREVIIREPWQKIVPHVESLEEAYHALVHQHLPFEGMPDIHVFELEPIQVQKIG